MAENFDDCEFWLPPHFLTDDLTHLNNNPKNDDVFDAVLKARFPYLSSPSESVVDSSETESEEEELMAELTRRMAHSTLQLGFPSENQKIVFGTVSPQSTLCTMESSRKGSSPNGSVSSQANTQKATWNLLRAAAGEVEKMKLQEEEEKVYGVLRNTVKPAPIDPGFYAHQQQQQHSLSYQQLQISLFEMMRRQQQLATQQQGGLVWGYGNGINYNNQMVPNRGRNDTVFQGLSSSAWPPLQQAKQRQQPLQQYGAVFHGNPSVKKERNGTGVFLPRVYNVPSESRKKPVADSAALVPERVAHAVIPKVQGLVGGYSQHNKNHFNGKSNMENGPVVTKIPSDNGFSGQKRNLRQQPQPVNHEILLPQEWTY